MAKEDNQDHLPELMKEFSEKLDAWEKKQNRQRLREKLITKVDALNIPLLYARGIIIDSEEQLDLMIEEIKKRYLLE